MNQQQIGTSTNNQYQPTRPFQTALAQEIQHSKAQLLHQIFTDIGQGYIIESYNDLVTRYLQEPPQTFNGCSSEGSTGCNTTNEPGTKASPQINNTKILNRIKLDGQYVYAEDIDGGKVFDDELRNLDMTVGIMDGKQLYHQNFNGGKVFDSNGNDIGIKQDGQYVLRQ